MKKVIVIIGEILIILISLRFAYDDYNDSAYLKKRGDKLKGEKIIDEVLNQDIYKQDIVTDIKHFDKLKIKTATYENQNKGYVLFTIKDEEGTVLYEGKIDVSKCKDNKETVIELDKEVTIDGNKITLELQGDESQVNGNAITIYKCDVPSNEGNILTKNDEEFPGVFEVRLAYTYWSIKRCIYLLICTTALYAYFIFMLRTIKQK
ncbi:MAG: hypothetical protein K6G26_12105 [Lachnospiraceae bacterium]|nr:hypothetical protein [Lachnospiraceae bacterium]